MNLPQQHHGRWATKYSQRLIELEQERYRRNSDNNITTINDVKNSISVNENKLETSVAVYNPPKPYNTEISVKPTSATFTGRLQLFVLDHIRYNKNLHRKVVPLKDYGGFHRHQLLCFFCLKPCLHDSFSCRSCSAVAHQLCLPSTSVTNLQFNCPQCQLAYKQDVQQHLVRTAKTEEELLQQYLKEKLGRLIFAFCERRKFRKKRISTIKIQSLVRFLIARRAFLRWRASQMRILVIDFMEIPYIHLTTGLVIISLFDPMSKVQLFRFEKSPLQALEEGFLIPGASMYCLIVISFCSTDEIISKQYNIVGQAVVSIRDSLEIFSSQTSFSLDVSNVVTWVPSEPKDGGRCVPTKYRLNVPGSGSDVMRGTTCRLRVNPLKAALSLVAGCCGPALGYLHRPGDKVYVRDKEKQSLLKSLTLTDVRSSRRYWMCMFDMLLYIYRDYGDSNPRFIMNMKDADVELSRTVPRSVCIVFGDSRTFVFELETLAEAVKLVFLCNEGKQVLSGNSKFMKQFPKHRPFGLTCVHI